MSDLALPTQQAPRQIAAAAATYAERLADLRRAVAAESSAEAGIAEAKRLAVLALVDARDAGTQGPSASTSGAPRASSTAPRAAPRPSNCASTVPAMRCSPRSRRTAASGRGGWSARQRPNAKARIRSPLRFAAIWL
jgi:hypothetical protein